MEQIYLNIEIITYIHIQINHNDVQYYCIYCQGLVTQIEYYLRLPTNNIILLREKVFFVHEHP